MKPVNTQLSNLHRTGSHVEKPSIIPQIESVIFLNGGKEEKKKGKEQNKHTTGGH